MSASDHKMGLTIPETASLMGIGRSSVYEMIGRGALPARKIGTRTIILRDDAVAALRRLPTVPVRQPRK